MKFSELVHHKQYINWSFPEDASPEKLSEGFSSVHKTEKAWHLSLDSSHIVLFVRDNTVFRIVSKEVFSEDFSLKLLQQLGTPELKLPAYYDVLYLPEGEWVFLKKGISLKLNPEKNYVIEIILFEPCDEAEYKKNIYVRPEVPRER